MVPKEKGSAVQNGAEKLSNMNPERSTVDVATQRMSLTIAGEIFIELEVLRTYFNLGFKKKITLETWLLKLLGSIRKI